MKKFICFIINYFGSGQHPMADETTFSGFTEEYIVECLIKALDSDTLSDEGRMNCLVALKQYNMIIGGC